MPSFVSQYTNDILRDTPSFHIHPVTIKKPMFVTAVLYFNLQISASGWFIRWNYEDEPLPEPQRFVVRDQDLTKDSQYADEVFSDNNSIPKFGTQGTRFIGRPTKQLRCQGQGLCESLNHFIGQC